MPGKRHLILLAVSLAPSVIYVAIQWIFQPRWGIGQGIVPYLNGVMPNFLGALSLAAVIFMGAEFYRPERERVAQLAMSAAIATVVLWLREFSQLSTSGTFDVHDLVWTVAGGALFYGLGRWLLPEEPVSS